MNLKRLMLNCVCYYFDDIMEVIHINVDTIFLDEKPYKNISVYKILCKKFMGAKPLPSRLNKVDWIIKIYDGIIYLKLSILYNEVYYRVDSRICNAIFV